MTDEQLLAAGDFDELKRRFAEDLACFVRENWPEAASHAEQIVERTFRRLARIEWDKRKNVRPWLYSISANVAIAASEATTAPA